MRLTSVSALACLTCLACFAAGCGIFDIRPPEPPLSDSFADDPLNIVDVIRGEFPEVLPGSGYGGYFTDDVEFHYNRLHPIYGREVIQMLERLRSGSPQSLHVTWGQGVNRWRDGNLQYLSLVPYTVHANGELAHEGIADFRILIGLDDYRITYWKDMPNGAPFFEPYIR